jgi:hypothetical protein
MLTLLIAAGLFAGLVTGCDDEDSPSAPQIPDPWVLDLNPTRWTRPSLPAQVTSSNPLRRRFQPADRAFARWYRPVPAVDRGDLDPDLDESQAREIVSALQIDLMSRDPDRWQRNEFGGVMYALAHEVVDLRSADFLEFWLNDFTGDPGDPSNPHRREGTLRFDFGFINQDFWWPPGLTDLEGYEPTLDTEDTDENGRLGPRLADPSRSEDTGLDGLADDEGEVPHFAQRPPRAHDPAGDNYDPSDVGGLYFNGTEGNLRLDSEDPGRSGHLEMRDGYFTMDVLLDSDDAEIDIYRDYPGPQYAEFLNAARARGTAWRLYRIPMRERVRYENDGIEELHELNPTPRFVIAGLRFGRDPERP